LADLTLQFGRLPELIETRTLYRSPSNAGECQFALRAILPASAPAALGSVPTVELPPPLSDRYRVRASPRSSLRDYKFAEPSPLEFSIQ